MKLKPKRSNRLIYWHGYSLKQIVWAWVKYLVHHRDIRRGVYVETCTFEIKRVARVQVVFDSVKMLDGTYCSLFHCGLEKVLPPRPEFNETLYIKPSERDN